MRDLRVRRVNNERVVCVCVFRTTKRLLALLAVAVCPDVFVEEDEEEEEEDEEEENDKTDDKPTVNVLVTNAGRLRTDCR